MNRLLAWGVSLLCLAGAGTVYLAAIDAHQLARGAAPVEVYDVAWVRVETELPALPEVPVADVRKVADDADLGPGTLPQLVLGVAVVTAAAGAARAGHRSRMRRC